MYRLSSSKKVAEQPIDAQFQNITGVLEDIQRNKAKSESITKSIAHCSRELQHLERIHSNRHRFHGPDGSDDPFALRDILQRFYTSCNALAYVGSPIEDFDNFDGCIQFPSTPKRGWKKKQLKTIEADYSEHERSLSLALSNAVYTTTQKMHRSKMSTDSGLTLILQQAERRHAFYEKQTTDSKDANKQRISTLKIEALKVEETDWEKSLRRYFEALECWTWESENEVETQMPAPSSRTSTFTESRYPQLVQRQSTTSLVRSNYGEFRRGEELDTGNVEYFRQPRRPSVTNRASMIIPSESNTNNRHSLNSNFSRSSNALVLYSPTSPTEDSTAVVRSRPIRRASISRDFHWEYVGNSSSLPLLAPLTARWPELKDAQVDIYTQTQGMSAKEARAYAQGRLACLDPEITNEVRRVLSGTPTSPTASQPALEAAEVRRVMPPPVKTATQSALVATEARRARPMLRDTTSERRRSVSLDPPTDRRKTLPAANPRAAKSQLHLNSQNVVPKLVSKPKQSRSIRNSLPNLEVQRRTFLSSLSDLRPLTAISERPSTSKSRASMKSMKSRASSLEKPPSRSLMQAFKNNRSNLSQTTILETVPDKGEGRSSSGSDTLTPEKDHDVETKSTLSASTNAHSYKSRSTHRKRAKPNTEKPLPPSPGKTSKLLGLFKSKVKNGDSHLKVPVPRSVLTSHSTSSFSHSRDSLRVSMELLRKKDSRATLLSMGEQPDMHFDVWLRALPYIEGRCTTPGNL
ncbi:hypothetical protein BT63DRAFT_423968 [Microthyrium microscopicum]|uniref:Uncharacterized protein n=1 Tax=Microthyrium microscopicum TaxID=703497 RepID=A0A6A6UED5_9PEZI|nr:hypothetical protein BT63DRAFT_423968 [Microthyrium microscopicum]